MTTPTPLTPTPRVDAERGKDNLGAYSPAHWDWVRIDFARALERECAGLHDLLKRVGDYLVTRHGLNNDWATKIRQSLNPTPGGTGE